MKKTFLILCVVMQCLGMQAQLGTTLYGGLLYNIYDDGTAECLGPDILDGLEQDIDFWEHYDENVIAYRAGLESAEIYEYVPYYDTDWEGNYHYVGEFLVTSIGDGAFRGCTNMTSVSIPWSVTTIGNYAFSSGNWGSEELGACSSLTSIDLSNVTSIGAGAFDGCTSLQTVNMPSEFNFDIQREIKEFTFRNCESLKAITIPYGCTTIAESAFDGCKSLQQVYFAENNTNPSNDRFLLETIGPRAFRYCESLQSFDFSMLNHLSFIGGGSFGGCKKLASVHFLNRFYTFEYAVFSECENLSSVTLPSTMTSIPQYFFEKCTSLTSIALPVIEDIGIGAFQESGLKSISLPPSLKSIGGYAFCGYTFLSLAETLLAINGLQAFF